MLEMIDEGILSRVPERGAYMPSITEIGEGARLSLWGSRSSPWATGCQLGRCSRRPSVRSEPSLRLAA